MLSNCIKNYLNTNIYFQITICFLVFAVQGCEKFAEVDPPITATTGVSVYKDDATAVAVLSGIYASLSIGDISSGQSGISALAGLSADELTLFSGSTNIVLNLFYKNELSSEGDVGPWKKIYSHLHTVNSALEGLEVSSNVTSSVKKQLIGEAKFLRAFFHLYLVNLYGDVPLVTTSSYQVNATIGRTGKEKVYDQMIADLIEAKSLLSDEFFSSDARTVTEDRVRPTKWAATALLARIYLYTGDWIKADLESTMVIDHNVLFNLEASLDNVFLKNSAEAVWQLMPVELQWNTKDARMFILNGGPDDSHRPLYISSHLLNSFDEGDQRKTSWIGVDSSSGSKFHYPYKYKSATENEPVTEYLMVLRLAEQYLIRAEARIRLGNTMDGANDLNLIRNRAGLPDSPASTEDELLNAILSERQKEMFTEWGHRWLDLKRTGIVDQYMSIINISKGGSWESTDQLFPLPFDDIRLNPNLTQNAGY